MINHNSHKKIRIPVWDKWWLIGVACLCFGCHEAVNVDGLQTESGVTSQTGEYGVSGGLDVQFPENELPSQDAHQIHEQQIAPDGVHANPENDSPRDLESNSQDESDGANHDDSEHHGHFQVLPKDETDPLSETENDAETEQDPSDNPTSDAVIHHDWAQPVEAPGLPNLFKVSEDVYRSAQPESGGFASAENLGIRTILSVRLTANDVVLAESEPTSLTLIHIPIAPVYITVEEILEVMKALDGAEKPILVHCLHGADRTGLIIALYRILYENWSKEEAKDELVNGGFGYHSAFTNILDFIDELDVDAFKTQLFGE